MINPEELSKNLNKNGGYIPGIRPGSETKKYITELEADIMPIDGLIAFANSEMGVKVFGEEMAKNVLAHAQDIKAKGAKYCDCPACKAVADILVKKEQML